MNREDIIRMAREAGFALCQGFFGEMLKDFANRVAAHEKEECAKTVEALFDEVSNLKLNNSSTNKLVNNIAAIFKVDIAAAIRARGEK
jgi:hypothetical protein